MNISKKIYYNIDNNNKGNNNDYNIIENITYKEPERKYSSFSNSNLNDNKKKNSMNYINKIELYNGCPNKNINYINNTIYENNKIKIQNNKDRKNYNNNNNRNYNINYQCNSNIDNKIIDNKTITLNEYNPLMNSSNDYSKYLQMHNEQNGPGNINSRNIIKNENKDEFKYNLLNHNNNYKNRKDRYTVYNKSNNNINNKIIITTSDYSKQNISNVNSSNINTNSNESCLISAKKSSNNQNSNKSLNSNNLYNEEFKFISPMQITDISNNKIMNTKISKTMHQLTENSMKNTINDRNLAKTTIKKISTNNYQFKRIIENNNNKKEYNYLNNYNIIDKTNLGKFQNISPYDKQFDQKPYVNLKYNLSFKKNFEQKSEKNSHKFLNDNNDLNHEKETKNLHRTNSNDINIRRRKYIRNINEYHFIREKDRNQNHSNVELNMLKRDFSTSSILSSNSQIKQNNNNFNNNINNNKKRDYSNNRNINNNNNDLMQLKTEITERAKSTYFKSDMNSINCNNNMINNVNEINYSKKNKSNYDYSNNSSHRNNIRYTKNSKFIESITSKKLNFQLNYESNQQKQNNIFQKKKINKINL